MGISMKIHNVKNIDDFEFVIPTEKGLYALTGENGSGKSTVISCAAAAFYVPSFYDYFGNPRDGAYIEFEFNGKKRSVREKDGVWKSPRYREFLGITGFYEGSIVFGNRFKDIDYSLLGKLALIKKEQLIDASDFVKKSLGNILHDDENYYKSLRFLYNGIIIKHQKTEPTYTKTSLFLCEKRRFFMARREKGVVPIIYFEKERGKSF